MKPIIIAAFTWMLCAPAVIAQCAGVDLRGTLTPSEAAQLTQRIAAAPFAQGNHWRATKGAIDLRIIGTVHMYDPRLELVAQRLAPLLNDADRIWLEATEVEEKALQRAVVDQPELLFLTTGPTLPELLPEEIWQDLSAAARARGIPAFMAAKFRPWYLSVLLSLPGCAMADLQSGQPGLDKMLIKMAQSADVPQIALEPFDTLFTLMDAEPLTEQLSFLHLGVLPNSAAEDSLATLLASYFDENTVEVLELARIVAQRHVDLPPDQMNTLFDDMLNGFLVARNQAWVDILKDAPAGLSLVAVGAGHLPGRTGVLHLLQAEGFTITRQEF